MAVGLPPPRWSGVNLWYVVGVQGAAPEISIFQGSRNCIGFSCLISNIMFSAINFTDKLLLDTSLDTMNPQAHWTPEEARRRGCPNITLKDVLKDDTRLDSNEVRAVVVDRQFWKTNFVMSAN